MVHQDLASETNHFPATKKQTIIQFFRMKSNLPEEDILKIGLERKPSFVAIEGLLQKYYVRINADAGEYGGIYVWDSEESMSAFQNSELAKTIAQAYQIDGGPTVESFEVILKLR
ncbi:MAG: hypothetical protein KDC53_14100 [Saprospiraceae bacterium]|nr:hypothetical protein [Saprospiraceae bacterium]